MTLFPRWNEAISFPCTAGLKIQFRDSFDTAIIRDSCGYSAL